MMIIALQDKQLWKKVCCLGREPETFWDCLGCRQKVGNWSTTHREWTVVPFAQFGKGTPASFGVGLGDPIRRHSRSNGPGAASAHLAVAQQMTRMNCSDDRSTQSIRNNSSAITATSSSSRVLTSCSFNDPVHQEDDLVQGTALAAKSQTQALA
jgi:hypothetical protein